MVEDGEGRGRRRQERESLRGMTGKRFAIEVAVSFALRGFTAASIVEICRGSVPTVFYAAALAGFE